MVRDLPAYKLRMPPELRQELEKQAELRGRSLHAEILARVRETLVPRARRSTQVEQPSADYVASDIEQKMLVVFRRLTPEKQLALLSLFK